MNFLKYKLLLSCSLVLYYLHIVRGNGTYILIYLFILMRSWPLLSNLTVHFSIKLSFLWDVTKYFDEHEYGLIISAMRHIVHYEIYCSLNKKMFWVWIYLVIYICVLLHFGNTLISRMTTQTTIVTWKKEKDIQPLLSIHFSFFRNDGNFNVTYWFNQMFI